MVRLEDGAGLAVGTDHPATVAAIAAFTTEILSHGQRAADLLPAAAADPGCALVQALAGSLYLFLQTAEGLAAAAPHLDAAERAIGSATERESLWVAALKAWAGRDEGAALDIRLRIAERWPRDLLNVKVAQVHQLNLGDRSGMRDLTAAMLPHNREQGFAWGLHAFALEQAGDPAAAEAAGLRAMDIHPDDPWAHHAVAHAFEARSEVLRGLAFLEPLAERWDRCSSFMYTHNWWHTALFRLALGDEAGALAIYDDRVWGVRKSYVQDQVNAISLLGRLELRGVDVGDRWRDVAMHAAARRNDRLNAFHDLHTVYALARAGEDEAADAMLRDLADSPSWLWRTVAAPAAAALAAHARGRYAEAAALGPLLPRLALLGGSTAQQRWFARLHRHAQARVGSVTLGYRAAHPARPSALLPDPC